MMISEGMDANPKNDAGSSPLTTSLPVAGPFARVLTKAVRGW